MVQNLNTAPVQSLPASELLRAMDLVQVLVVDQTLMPGLRLARTTKRITLVGLNNLVLAATLTAQNHSENKPSVLALISIMITAMADRLAMAVMYIVI